MDKTAFGQAALAVLLLLGEDVALVSVLSFDLTAPSEAETLLRTGISLHFWHLYGFKEGKDRDFMQLNKENPRI